MAKTQLYTVNLRKGFGAPQRVRSGRMYLTGSLYTLELTADELAALKADPEFEVGKAKGNAQVNENGVSIGNPTAEESAASPPEPAAPPESDTSGVEDAQGDEAAAEAGQADTGSAPPTADELAANHSREELDNMAKEAGIADPEQLANKLEVADAILANRSEG